MSEPVLPLAIVTGAAHRIGRAIALGLAKQGYAIGLHYHHSLVAARETASVLMETTHVPVYLLPGDLCIPGEIDNLFNTVTKLSHRLEVLVNSAAVMTSGSLREMDTDLWGKTMDLNLRAPWLCSRAAAGLMGTRGGVIVNISDSGAQRTWTGYPAYVVSKAGLEVLTRLLAREYAPHVRVNAVAPGLILPSLETPSDTWDKLVNRLPLKVSGRPEDIAQAVLFFVQSPYITGQVLAVDGGYQII